MIERPTPNPRPGPAPVAPPRKKAEKSQPKKTKKTKKDLSSLIDLNPGAKSNQPIAVQRAMDRVEKRNSPYVGLGGSKGSYAGNTYTTGPAGPARPVTPATGVIPARAPGAAGTGNAAGNLQAAMDKLMGSSASSVAYRPDAGLQKQFNSTMADLAADKRRVDSEFAKEKDALQKRYNLAETAQEKARLKFALTDLTNQHQAYSRGVKISYDAAIKNNAAVAGTTRADGKVNAASIAAIYNNAAKAVGVDNSRQATAGGASLGLNAVPVSGDAASAAGDLAVSGAAQASLSQQLAGIQGAELDYLGSALGGEAAAQQAALTNNVAGLRAETVGRYQQQVSDRINAERLQLNAALEQLFGGRQQALGALGQEGRSTRMSYGTTEAGRRDQVTAMNAQSRDSFESDRRSLAGEYIKENFAKISSGGLGSVSSVGGDPLRGSTVGALLDSRVNTPTMVPVETGQLDKGGAKEVKYVPVHEIAGRIRTGAEQLVGLPIHEQMALANQMYTELYTDAPHVREALTRDAGIPSSAAELVKLLNGPAQRAGGVGSGSF